ncbi:MAG: class I SAM-dependent methyltransferase [Deltaproteobacteria bacterium]|nr:class I SAM-dependent methyltransferase [Deltaproteobacteria bacterium]
MSVQEKSYRRHADHFKPYRRGGERVERARTWLQVDTVDAWRHRRLYQVLDPILIEDPKATWLTVGDGRYGKDAKYILDRGCDALATDISDHLLQEAVRSGFLPRYRRENAESLSFGDSTFDYVFCKDSYHHFPRPMVAFYEMLRVARKGVVLIEPNDYYLNEGFIQTAAKSLKKQLRALRGKQLERHLFEESGNYIYCVSRREIEKAAVGLDCRVLAFRGINDFYLAGVEYEKISTNGRLQTKLRLMIRYADLMCRLGAKEYQLLAALVFKEGPATALLTRLSGLGFEIRRLPVNPYLTS